jgi:hypothetical protein
MTNKFLETGDTSNLTDGSVNIFANSLSAFNLQPSKALKTGPTKIIYSTDLDIADVSGLQEALDNASGAFERTGVNIIPKDPDGILNINNIIEETGDNGVLIEGVKLKDSIVETDTIIERSSGLGTTIEGVKIQDSEIVFPDANNTSKIHLNNDITIGTDGTRDLQIQLGDDTKKVFYKFGSANRLSIEEVGTDCKLNNPNGSIFIEGTEVNNVNLSNVNRITFQDENLFDKLILKTDCTIGVTNNDLTFRGPTGNHMEWGFNSTEYMRLDETSLKVDKIEEITGGDGVTIDGLIVLGNTQSEFNKTFSNAGYVSGGGITDNVDGTVDIAGVVCYLRTTNSDTGEIKYFSVSGVTNLPLTDLSNNYVYVDYNAGFPNIQATTTGSTIRDNENTQFELYEIYRSGTKLTISDHKQRSGNTMNKLQRWIYEKYGHNKTDGLVLSEQATREVTHTLGRIWIKLNDIDVAAHTAGTNFSQWFFNGSTWAEVTTSSQWDNTNYNNVASGLVELTPSRYGFHEYYVLADGSLHSVYGQAEYNTLASAESAPILTNLPPVLGEHKIFIGRIVFQKSASTASTILTPTDTILNTIPITDHGNLAGLSDDDHPQYALLNGRVSDILKINSIQEFTTDNGVLIDDITLKDDSVSGTTLSLKGSTSVSLTNSSDVAKLTYTNGTDSLTTTVPMTLSPSTDTALTFDGDPNAIMHFKRNLTTGACNIKYSTTSTDHWEVGLISNQNDYFIYSNNTTNYPLRIGYNTDVVSFSGGIKVDNIYEYTGNNGVTIDGVTCLNGIVKATAQVQSNVISEYTADNGVSVDSVFMKDGTMTANPVSSNMGIIINGNTTGDAQMKLVRDAVSNKTTFQHFTDTTMYWETGMIGTNDYSFYNNSTSNTLLSLNYSDDTVQMPTVYSDTVTSSRDLEIDSTGKLGYVSSVKESKMNITYDFDTTWLYKLEPCRFNYKKKIKGKYIDSPEDEVSYGMIAEDVEEINKDMCFYDDDKLRGISYKKFIPILIAEIKNLADENLLMRKRMVILEKKCNIE